MTRCLLSRCSPRNAEAIPMYIAEFFGTMIVSCTFAMVTRPSITFYGPSGSDTPQHQESFVAPVAVGFVIIALIYAFGHISGAHFNPAITISVYCRGFITLIDSLIFIVMQLTGSIVGAFIAIGFTGELPYIEPGAKYKDSYGRLCVVEMIYTFAVAVVAINVATTESQRGNFFYGVSIGMCVCAGMATAQKISGGAFNPAIGTALSITNAMRATGTGRFVWIYWTGPMLGGYMGGLSYHVLNAKEIEQSQMFRQQQAQQSLAY